MFKIYTASLEKRKGCLLMFKIDDKDLNGTNNGDIVIRTDKGVLVLLIFAAQSKEKTLEGAKVIVDALNKAWSGY